MKIALVTGGSRGIGKAVCLKLASEGYHVIINYVSNDEAARATLEQITSAGGSAELLKFDVSDNEATVSALKAWQQAHPDEFVEVLVNNAGIRRDNLLLWMEQDDWYKVMKTNLDSFYNVTRPLLQPMVVHKRGRIVNMASLSGQKGLPGQTNYSAAKGGIIAATKALAQEVAARKVTVNAVAPGFIRTDMVVGPVCVHGVIGGLLGVYLLPDVNLAGCWPSCGVVFRQQPECREVAYVWSGAEARLYDAIGEVVEVFAFDGSTDHLCLFGIGKLSWCGFATCHELAILDVSHGVVSLLGVGNETLPCRALACALGPCWIVFRISAIGLVEFVAEGGIHAHIAVHVVGFDGEDIVVFNVVDFV